MARIQAEKDRHEEIKKRTESFMRKRLESSEGEDENDFSKLKQDYNFDYQVLKSKEVSDKILKGEEFYLFEEFDIEKNIDILYFK